MRYLCSALLIVLTLCMFSGVAVADDIHVVFDPVPAPPTIGSFNLIQQTNTPYLVNWVSCSTPGISDPTIAAQQACLLFINQTGKAIKDLEISFTVNAAIAGQTIACDSVDSFLTSNSCGSVPGATPPINFESSSANQLVLALGQVVTVDFFGGDPIGNNMAFFFGETGSGTNLSDAPPVTISVPTPEPGTLVLMLAGFAVVAFSLLRKAAA